MKNFNTVSEREVLALAIALEEEDERIYGEYAERLRQDFSTSAAMFDQMGEEESGHRRRLLELYRKRFGDNIPLIRRHDVGGFISRKPVWLTENLGLAMIRKQVATMEIESFRFYEKADGRAEDVDTRQLLDDLAKEERSHESRAEELEKEKLSRDARAQERAQPRTPAALKRAYFDPASLGFRRPPRTPPGYIWRGRSTRLAQADSAAPTFSGCGREIQLGFAAVPPVPIANPIRPDPASK